jgi:hypothetical protein
MPRAALCTTPHSTFPTLGGWGFTALLLCCSAALGQVPAPIPEQAVPVQIDSGLVQNDGD